MEERATLNGRIGQGVDMSAIEDMAGLGFEDVIDELLSKAGFEVLTGQAYPEGIDFVARCNRTFFQGTYIIHCKRSAVLVEESAVRNLYGTVMSERANKGILITNSVFTQGAIAFARSMQIELIDGQGLLSLLSEHGLIDGQKSPLDLLEEEEARPPAEKAKGAAAVDISTSPAEEWKSAEELKDLNDNLIIAAQIGDAQKADALLRAGADPNATDRLGTTVLHLVVLWGHKELVDLLIAKGANVNAKDDERWTPLHVAAMKGYKDIAETLVAHGAGFNVLDRKGKTPLDLAKDNRHKDMADFLRNFGGKVAAPSERAAPAAKRADSAELLAAVKDGDIDRVRTLLGEGASLKTKDDDGSTPLHIAAREGGREIVELLIDRGANVGAENNEKLKPIDVAVSEKVVELLMAKDRSVTLHTAAMKGNKLLVEMLLAKGADVNAKNAQLSTPLDLAALRGHRDVVELLIENGANVDTKDKIGSTPLHWAAFQGHGSVVDLLASKTRNVNARNADDKSPLEVARSPEIKNILRKHGAWTEKDLPTVTRAIQSGNAAAVKVILDAAPGLVHATEKDGPTLLHAAAFLGHEDIVELLIQKGANLDAMGKKREAPLHLAALKGHVEIVRLLIAHDANVNAKGQRGETPLHFASVYGHKDIVVMLIANGAHINVKNEWGMTSLHAAAWRGPMDIVELLIKMGAEVNVKDAKGNTPLDWAGRKGRKDVAELLEAAGGKPGA